MGFTLLAGEVCRAMTYKKLGKRRKKKLGLGCCMLQWRNGHFVLCPRKAKLRVVGSRKYPMCDSCYGDRMSIDKTKKGFRVVSKKGRNLGGPFRSKLSALRRLAQVEHFKHRKR